MGSSSSPVQLARHRSPRPNRSPDVDGDGALDYLELALGFDPRSADDPLPAGGTDSDQDGLSDALEELLRLTSTPEPISPASDADGDGLYDHLELQLASDRHHGDSPILDGGLDRVERTGPAGDGISDALEHYLILSGAQRPVTTRSDSDGDLLPDYLEVRLALDAFDASSPLADGSANADDDGVSNALEFVLLRLGAARPSMDAPTPTRTARPITSRSSRARMPSRGTTRCRAERPTRTATGSATRRERAGHAGRDCARDLAERHRRRRHPGWLRGALGHAPAARRPSARERRQRRGRRHRTRDTISDALESLLVRQGATPPVTRGNDSDQDGAPDHLEVFAGSLPTDADSPLPNGAADTDGDRVTDALEKVLVLLGGPPPRRSRTRTGTARQMASRSSPPLTP